MKLGEMRRYGTAEGKLAALPNGAYVLFSDAQAKSLADERRIQELATDTIEVLKVVEALGPDSRCAVCGTRFDHKPTCVIGNTMKRVEAALRVETK